MDEVKRYISFLTDWICGKCDITMDPITQFEVIRMLYDSFEEFNRDEQSTMEQLREELQPLINDINLEEIKSHQSDKEIADWTNAWRSAMNRAIRRYN